MEDEPTNSPEPAVASSPPETVNAESFAQSLRQSAVSRARLEVNQEVPAKGRLIVIPIGGVFGLALGIITYVPFKAINSEVDHFFPIIGLGVGLLAGVGVVVKPYFRGR